MDYQLKGLIDKNLSVTEQIFFNRGIAVKDIPHYLNTSQNDEIDPASIKNIEDGAKMLIQHIYNNDRVYLQVDADCDGFTSAAVLMNYLNCLFPSFTQNNIIYSFHPTKAHGIDAESIPDDVKLIIAPDASSNEYEIHEQFKQQGVDILIIDHHQAEKESPYACVINNQLCDYPTKSLSGVGMVYKFCSYLDNLLQTDYSKSYLDLVALGIIADVMDLRDFETRYLITQGLSNIINPFIKAMVAANEYTIGSKLTPHGVAFSIAPGVNAITRVGTMEEKKVLFESMLEFKAYESIPSTKRGCKGQFEPRVTQSCRNCNNVRNRQNKARDTSIEIIENIIKQQNLLENKILTVRLDKTNITNKNITGLIANQLMGKYQRPVLVLNQTVHQDENDSDNSYIMWEGSGRNADGTELKNLQAFLQSTGLVEYAEGHENALGVGIKDENIETFISYSNEALKDVDFDITYDVDFIYDPKLLQSYEILDIAKLSDFWGKNVEEPYIAIENVKVFAENLQLMKGTTLKITLASNPDISLIKFKSSEEEYESLYSEMGCVIINVIGRCTCNSWDNKPQVKIEDYEIVGRTAYYF